MQQVQRLRERHVLCCLRSYKETKLPGKEAAVGQVAENRVREAMESISASAESPHRPRIGLLVSLSVSLETMQQAGRDVL